MISVLILTKNEIRDLPECLKSLGWSNDVVIFDSFSTDGTERLAHESGARVFQRSFDNYASQRNAALEGVVFRNEWILSVDADERIPSELAMEMLAYCRSAPESVSAIRIRRRDFFRGRWLRHAQISPFFIRLFRRGKVKYRREINEVLEVDGEVVDMLQPFDHYPFSKGIGFWIERHNFYSSLEAKRAVAEAKESLPDGVMRTLLSRDFNKRRYAQKLLFYRMPFRPIWKLIYMLIVRRSFLDGTPGIQYTILQCIYEYFICLKEVEIASVTDFEDSVRRLELR